MALAGAAGEQAGPEIVDAVGSWALLTQAAGPHGPDRHQGYGGLPFDEQALPAAELEAHDALTTRLRSASRTSHLQGFEGGRERWPEPILQPSHGPGRTLFPRACAGPKTHSRGAGKPL